MVVKGDSQSEEFFLVPTLGVGTHAGPLRGPSQTGSLPRRWCARAAERRRPRAHAERGHEKKGTAGAKNLPVNVSPGFKSFCTRASQALQWRLPSQRRREMAEERVMSSPDSVTYWITQLKAGERAAAQPLWENYFRRLLARARHKLAGIPRRAADEEDVALSAFDSFCRAAEQGRFPQLHDRHDLWQVLVVITDRKASDLVQFERCQKRGEGKVLDEAALDKPHEDAAASPLAEILSREPSPEFAAQVAEECRRLLGLLQDAELQHIAIAKMEGYTIEEIAERLGVVPRTVKRRLQLIRRTWEQELQS
jgi:DNA-directed RNA polymerase specialized sigma24 family protein